MEGFSICQDEKIQETIGLEPVHTRIDLSSIPPTDIAVPDKILTYPEGRSDFTMCSLGAIGASSADLRQRLCT